MEYNINGGNWVKMTAGREPPSNAFIGGHDADGSPMFVGRAHHNGGRQPVKIYPNTFHALMSYNGEEISKHDIEILCGEEYHWVSPYKETVPEDAVVGCYESNGVPLFIGRVHHWGFTSIGKVQRRTGVCEFPFNGQVVYSADYLVLVKDN